MNDEELQNWLNQTFERRVRHAMVTGFFVGRLLKHEREKYTACADVPGEGVTFSGRLVCDVSNVDLIEDCIQREKDGDVMIACNTTSKRSIFVTPNSLNKWRLVTPNKKMCAGDVCYFEGI